MCKYDTKTTLVLLPAVGEASWSLLPSLVSLLSGGTVQPENTYSSILKAPQLPPVFISLSQSQLI